MAERMIAAAKQRYLNDGSVEAFELEVEQALRGEIEPWGLRDELA